MGVNKVKNQVRKAKKITNPKDIEYILSMTSEQCAEKQTIMELFADFGDGPKYNTYDIIDIPPKTYGKTKKNKSKFTTTVGIYVFNKGMLEDVCDVIGYINEPITADKYSEINQELSYALLEDKITVEQLKQFIIQSQIYMSCASALSPSHTMKMLLVTNEIEKKKKELHKKYKDGIEKKDVRAVSDMENELLDFAKEYMKGDPSMDMYDSGARSSWGNNFKNMYVMKGAVRLTDGSYDVVESSYISGLDKKDFVKTNDSAVGGPYSRAVNTKDYGYIEKLFVSAYQDIKILKPGSDCGTKETISITLNNSNIKQWMYCFVVGNNGSLTEITSENKDKFIGKTVKLRFSALCKAKDGICEKCAGTLFNRIGISNVGPATAQIASALKNASMKKFHDSTLNLYEINPNKFFGIK